MTSRISQIALKSTLSAVSALSVLSAGCVAPPTNLTFEQAQGEYEFTTTQSFLSATGSGIEEDRMFIPTSDLAGLFASATATSVRLSSSETEVTAVLSTADGERPLTALQSDYVALSGPNSAGDYYPVACSSRSRSGVCQSYSLITAFEISMQSAPTEVSVATNGCSTETREFLNMRFQANGGIMFDTYLDVIFVDNLGTGAGVIPCHALLQEIGRRISRSDLMTADDALFNTFVVRGVLSLEDLPYVDSIQMGFQYDGVKVAASEEAGVATAPLVGGEFQAPTSATATLDLSNIDVATVRAQITRALQTSHAALSH